jgi:DNA-binding Xre family transcriptional regulator
MLTFNPKNIFLLRGIEKTTAFLVRLGMDYSTASRFLKSKSQFVKVKDIEKLCIALNCTPNDLFEWKPSSDTVLPEMHSLNALNKGDKVKELQQIVRDIPADKLTEIEVLLNELKK